MFWTSSQAAVSQDLLNEIATSSAVPDPMLIVYGVLGALAVATLATGYLLFGRSGRRSLPDQH